MLPSAGWSSLTEESRRELYLLYDAGKLTHNHALDLGMNLQTLKRRLREYRETMTPTDAGDMLQRIAANSVTPKPLEEYFFIEDDNVMICSDWHWPLTDVRMIALLLLTAMRHNIRRLLIVGDTSNFDEYSHWPVKVHDSLPPQNVQMAALSRLLSILLEWFHTIEISGGNHDERLQIATKGNISLADFLSFSNPEVRYSMYRYMWLKTSRELLLLMHPENYRAISMALSQELATRYVPPEPFHHTTFGAIVAHTHIASTGFTKNGLHPAVGLGCMFDPNLASYKKRGGAVANQWNMGFVMVKDGYINSLVDGHVDWKFWLGDYYPALEKLVAK